MKKELLIFGSNGALGKGAAKTLKTKNYDKIYLFDFHPQEDKLDPAVQMIKIEDLSNEENVKKAFSMVKASTDTAFFLFSTIGGFAGGKKIWDYDEEEFDKMMNMNLKANFLIAKYFSQLVKISHSGSICFTSAFVSISAEEGKSAYGASKSALSHLVDTLSEEGNGIRLSANAIAPYILDTQANRDWMGKADFNTWIKPGEIGEIVQSIFNNYNFFTGNLLKLKGRFSLD
jgi:NAD(P)-dependent dehydrogenase (short-subunit alcohol dehydrogenase family)